MSAAETREKWTRRLMIAALVVVGLAVYLYFMWGGPPKGPTTAAVRGVVTYQGQRLNGGQIRFTSRDPANPVGQTSGMIQRDGSFAFGGIPTGPVTITVDTNIRPAGDRFWKPGDQSPQPIYIPDRFADPNQSGVTLELKEGVRNYNVDLN
jgi:hypothetical protein